MLRLNTRTEEAKEPFIVSQKQSALASLNGGPAQAVNEKNLEDQKRRLRFRQLADYFFRYSGFFQSALKHR